MNAILMVALVSAWLFLVGGSMSGWRTDGINLMQHQETREYGCFGCRRGLCFDPSPFMLFVSETPQLHCGNDFRVVGIRL